MAFDIEAYNRSEFWLHPPELRDKWEDIYCEMTVHTQGNTPAKLLEERRPNEDENIWEYRKTIYQPITKGPINRSINKLYRIFMNANFSYQINDRLREYISEGNFHGKTFNEYIHGQVIKRMIEDPNGYLVWLPAGAGLTDQTQKVEVVPYLIESEKIQTVNDEVLTWTDEDLDDHQTADVYFTLTKDGWYSHIKSDNNTYTLQVLYMHEIGEMPALVLGGMPTDDGILESYFSPFLPFGNEAIRQYSDWQAICVTSAYPFKTEQYTDCDYPLCQGKGWFYPSDCEDGDCDEPQQCPVCGGSGHKPHNSPYGVYIRREPGPGEDMTTAPMVEFTSPAVDIIEYSQKSWETLLEAARFALFDMNVDEAQSGVAKIVDREDFYAFLTNISNNIFDNLVSGSLWIIQQYRDINSTEEPVVIKPTSFVVKTEQALVAEIGELMEKKVPAAFVLESIKDLTKKRFSNDETTSKLVNFLMIYDPLFALSTEEKAMMAAGGYVTLADMKRNAQAYGGLKELLMKDPELLEKDYEIVSKQLDEKLGINGEQDRADNFGNEPDLER